MKRFALFLMATAVASVISPGLAPAADSRHSGRILDIDPSARTVRIEEMKAWTGPGTGISQLALQISPDASLRVVARGTGVDTGGWPNAWQERPITLDALKPGDFVNVTRAERGGGALVLEVVRPES
jgi:hypothetical protein